MALSQSTAELNTVAPLRLAHRLETSGPAGPQAHENSHPQHLHWQGHSIRLMFLDKPVTGFEPATY